ncbi:MAG TPA: c-type cytochrome [Alphaproteobacteria bacterium]|nr:c-type cytochrome [Alphaproteobacteria bacterium]
MTKRRIKVAVAPLVLALLCSYATVLPRTVAAEAASPTSPGGNTELITRGKRLFISYGCGWCHEDAGRKAGKGPQLMNTQRDDNFILTRIATGSPGKMPAFGAGLSADDYEALLTYIRSLKPETNP